MDSYQVLAHLKPLLAARSLLILIHAVLNVNVYIINFYFPCMEEHISMLTFIKC